MEDVLKTLNDLAGANATIVFNVGGEIIAHGGKAIYDRTLLEQVADTLVKVIESIELQHSDWEAITTQFDDGKLLLRNLGSARGKSHSLALISDATLNSSFATVAMRVAATKLKAALESGIPLAARPPSSDSATRAAPGSESHGASGPTGAASPPPPPRPPPPPADAGLLASSNVLASSGLTWSQAGTSSMGRSSIAVADPASSAYLTFCVKELARYVGPMSRVLIKESVRRVCPGVPFSLASAQKLAADLEDHIADAADRMAFRMALEGS